MELQRSETSPGSILRWLGIGGERGDGEIEEGAPQRSSDGLGYEESRRALLDRISAFLIDNKLRISADNLIMAHGAFSGTNPMLAREIAARVESGEEITQMWLEDIVREIDRKDDQDSIQILMSKLESTLESFTQSSTAVRNATSEYSDELEQHVAELAEVEKTGQIISNLADLAKAMLERTRNAETEMRRSEEQAKALRLNLEKAKRDAEIDHLTGLPNRRAFENLLEHHYREAQAEVEPLSVAFCDIDHFKRINDTHGHDAGDRVLKIIAESLARITNDSCHVARHGGEEFVMLFRGLTPEQAKDRLDIAREQMSERRLVNRKTEKPFGTITFSGGIADVFSFPNKSSALAAADAALYQAKENGRNQIMVAGTKLD